MRSGFFLQPLYIRFGDLSRGTTITKVIQTNTINYKSKYLYREIQNDKITINVPIVCLSHNW